jgi:hypothetical protein
MKQPELDIQTEFEEHMLGQSGPEKQLSAFRYCWSKGEAYIRAINQAAIGCSELCKTDEARAQVEALALASGDVVLWFEHRNLELLALELMAGRKEGVMH